MNKMKKHSKKLAALLSAFQFFGSGAQKTRGMDLISGLFLPKPGMSYKIDRNVLDSCKKEILNPSRENKIFNYKYIKELQYYFNAEYGFVMKMCASYKEPTMLGFPSEFKPAIEYYEKWGKTWGFNEKDFNELNEDQKKDFMDCLATYIAIDKCLGRQVTLKQTDHMASVIGKGAIQTLGIFSLEVAAVILGIKYGAQQIDRFMDSRACKSEQREFDKKMKEQMGKSSVDFTKSWEKVEKELSELRDEYPHNKDVQFVWGGDMEQQKETGSFLVAAFLIAICIKFLILVAQYNSIYYAALTLSIVVLAVAGVLVMLVITGKPFCVAMAGMGIISIAGIVVSNNIVLIDTFQELINKYKLPTKEAIIKTMLSRLRPVLITTTTTVSGLIPMMFNFNIDFATLTFLWNAPSGQWWEELATTICGGVLCSLILTLTFTPAMLMIKSPRDEEEQ